MGMKENSNGRFFVVTSHYLFGPEFCNPAAEPQGEKSVRDARYRFSHLIQYTTCADPNCELFL